MKKTIAFSFLVMLPLFLTACAETCQRPVEFQNFRNEEDGVQIPVEINGVNTTVTMRKVDSAPEAIYESSQLSQRLDDMIYKNCEKLQQMSAADKKKFLMDNAKYDDLLDDLLIVYHSPAEVFPEKLANWVERAKSVMER